MSGGLARERGELREERRMCDEGEGRRVVPGEEREGGGVMGGEGRRVCDGKGRKEGGGVRGGEGRREGEWRRGREGGGVSGKGGG